MPRETGQIWPPDFDRELERRDILRQIFLSTDDKRALAAELYQKNPVAFINDWCITFDPRNPSRKDPKNLDKTLPAKMPFILFKRQRELVLFFIECMEGREAGLVEKSRDMGATWVTCCFSVWAFLFVPGAAIGWGSRKQELVDRLGDQSSIFEKIRMIIRDLPDYMLPEGFDEKQHLNFMRITSPTGESITGESGDNIGRGGRTTFYIKDEAAHIERPELIEAALGDNTECQIDISSVNGPNNVFHRKRLGGEVKVFILDWRDHPAKDEAWYNARRKKAESEGLLHIFAQEVDRDYMSAVEGTLIPGVWVKAAIDAHIRLGIDVIGIKRVGFDVADGGRATNCVIYRHGIVALELEEWGGDAGEATSRAIRFSEKTGAADLVYDSPGVGAVVKATARHIKTPVRAIPYSGVGVSNPKANYTTGKLNEDMFASGSAQDWWLLRDRFYHTYQAVVKGREFDPNKCISLSSTMGGLSQLCSEVSQIVRKDDMRGRVKIDKTPEGTKSPNCADALKIAYSVEPDYSQPYVDFMRMVGTR